MAIPNKILIGSLVTITSLSAFVLTSTTVNAEGQQPKTALIQVLSSCTMSGTVSSAHTKNIANGTYASGIGETVISSVCNDAGGFAVYNKSATSIRSILRIIGTLYS